MSKKGTKIKDLARDLGITSRQLIDRCRSEGLPVQNSITRIDGRTEQAVRRWFDRTSTDQRAQRSAPDTTVSSPPPA